MTTEETHTNPRNGSITAGLTTGIIGTALGGLAALGSGNGGVLGGLFGGNQNNYVTKEEFDLNSQIMARDGEIALLKADKYTNAKLLEVYNDINDKVEKLNSRIDCNRNYQDGVNCQQAVLNATQGGMINCLQGQVAQMQTLCKYTINNSAICPGWGPVAIAPQSAVSILSA